MIQFTDMYGTTHETPRPEFVAASLFNKTVGCVTVVAGDVMNQMALSVYDNKVVSEFARAQWVDGRWRYSPSQELLDEAGRFLTAELLDEADRFLTAVEAAYVRRVGD